MRYLLFTFILSLTFAIFASDDLVAKQKTGDTTWAIYSIKEISFDGNGVKLLFNDETSVYYSKDVLTMIKFNDTESSVNEINTNHKITIVENTLTIPDNTDEIKIFSLDGTLVMQGKGSQLKRLSIGDLLMKSPTPMPTNCTDTSP